MQADNASVGGVAALSHRGWMQIDWTAILAGQGDALADEVSAALKAVPVGQKQGGSPVLLAYSSTIRTVLDSFVCERLLETTLGFVGPLLSRCDAMRGPVAWRREFMRIRKGAPQRRFRPGVELLLPVSTEGLAIEMVDCGHLLPAGRDLAQAVEHLPLCRIEVPQGHVVLLDAGQPWRITEEMLFARLTFVCGWIRPDYLHSDALEADLFAAMGSRARALCGEEIGLPVSVADFLAIEKAALDGNTGKVKGSGI